MIIYGTKAKTLEPTEVADAICPHCHEAGVLVHPVRRYAHLYFIPVFPLDRLFGIECLHCHEASDVASYPTEMQAEMDHIVRSAPTPRVLFSWFYIAAGIFIVATYVGWKRGKDTAAYVTEPKVGDVVVLKADAEPGFPYVRCKVVGLEGDSLMLQFGSHAYRDASDAAARDGKGSIGDTLVDELYMVGVRNLPALMEDGTIERIVRP